MVTIIYKFRNKYIYLLLLVLVIFSGCLGKEHLPQPKSGDFYGKITDQHTNVGIPGVKVDFGNGISAVTNINGEFLLEMLPPGAYQISCTRDWYSDLVISDQHVGKNNLKVFQMLPESLSGGILYSSNENQENKREIFYLNLETGKVEKLFAHPGTSETNPAQLGQNSLLFESDLSGNTELYIYDLSSQQLSPLASSIANDEHPSVDRSASLLVFQSNRAGQRNIYLYRLGSNEDPTVIGQGQNPVINPSGTKVAYVNTKYKLNIYDIANKTTVELESTYKINNPCWSPDESSLAIEFWNDTGDPRFIGILDLDSKEFKQVTFRFAEKDEHKHPAWSYDGKSIFFSANICFNSRMDLYVIKVDDGLLLQEAAPWRMLSPGSGDKDCPSWGEF